MTSSVTRRKFLLCLLSAAILIGGVSLLAWRYWWKTRRLLIRFGLLKHPANFLRNAKFKQCTTPGFPDYWGTPSASEFRDSKNLLILDDDAPISGVQSIRLSSPETDRTLAFHSYNIACDMVIRDAKQPYTFSVYLKSTAEKSKVQICANDDQKEVMVGGKWERYSLTANLRPDFGADIFSRFLVRVMFTGIGSIWVAAPQLEVGSQPTSFVSALIDDHPLPELPWASRDEYRKISNASILTATSANQFRRCLVDNGKPFLVFGIAYEQESDAIQQWHFEDIADNGFNTVALVVNVRDQHSVADVAIAAKQRIEEAHQRGLRIIPFLSYAKDMSFEAISNCLVHVMGKLNDHPAIIAWQIVDEPSHWWVHDNLRTLSQLDDLYLLAKKIDPERPVFINESFWTQGSKLSSTDIGIVDNYPIGHYHNGVKNIADIASVMNLDCAAASKPTGFWLQLYGGFWDGRREPTFEEMLAMCYLNFISGTRVLLFYLYKPMNPALWERMKLVKEELVKIFDITTNDEAVCVCLGTSAIRVHYGLWRLGNILYLLACNAGPEPVSAHFDIGTLTGLKVTSARSWYTDGNISVANSRFNITFTSHERYVLEMDCAN